MKIVFPNTDTNHVAFGSIPRGALFEFCGDIYIKCDSDGLGVCLSTGCRNGFADTCKVIPRNDVVATTRDNLKQL